MGIGGIGIWQLLIVLVIIILLFGTKKLRNIGGDLGGALKSFRKAVKEGDTDKEEPPKEQLEEKEGDVIEGEVTSRQETASREKDKA